MLGPSESSVRVEMVIVDPFRIPLLRPRLFRTSFLARSIVEVGFGGEEHPELFIVARNRRAYAEGSGPFGGLPAALGATFPTIFLGRGEIRNVDCHFMEREVTSALAAVRGSQMKQTENTRAKLTGVWMSL